MAPWIIHLENVLKASLHRFVQLLLKTVVFTTVEKSIYYKCHWACFSVKSFMNNGDCWFFGAYFCGVVLYLGLFPSSWLHCTCVIKQDCLICPVLGFDHNHAHSALSLLHTNQIFKREYTTIFFYLRSFSLSNTAIALWHICIECRGRHILSHSDQKM